MEILTKRPMGMSQKNWKQYNADLKQYIKRIKSIPIWFAKGLPERGQDLAIIGTALTRWVVQPMGTYRRGMKTLSE
jgi:hypothetical protein